MDGIGYTGHGTDGGTGLIYMQRRYYDPTIPRFLSVDPVAFPTPPSVPTSIAIGMRPTIAKQAFRAFGDQPCMFASPIFCDYLREASYHPATAPSERGSLAPLITP
ncbi:RHS repeat-associated core domain-containing protein, partial [Xanthomonas vasicola]